MSERIFRSSSQPRLGASKQRRTETRRTKLALLLTQKMNKRLNLKQSHPVVEREIANFLLHNTEFSEAALRKLELRIKDALEGKSTTLPELKAGGAAGAAAEDLQNEEVASQRSKLSKASRQSQSVTTLVLTLVGSQHPPEGSIPRRKTR